jgi:hypothetical protein
MLCWTPPGCARGRGRAAKKRRRADGKETGKRGRWWASFPGPACRCRKERRRDSRVGQGHTPRGAVWAGAAVAGSSHLVTLHRGVDVQDVNTPLLGAVKHRQHALHHQEVAEVQRDDHNSHVRVDDALHLASGVAADQPVNAAVYTRTHTRTSTHNGDGGGGRAAFILTPSLLQRHRG